MAFNIVTCNSMPIIDWIIFNFLSYIFGDSFFNLIHLLFFKTVNIQYHLPLWSASGIAVRCSALLCFLFRLPWDINRRIKLHKAFPINGPTAIAKLFAKFQSKLVNSL